MKPLLLPLLLAAWLAAGGAAPPPDDLYRPHAGFKQKTKLCMRCRHVLSAAKAAEETNKKNAAALAKAKAQLGKAKAAAKAGEAAQAAAAAKVGDPMFGRDPMDPARVKADAALSICMQLPEIAQPACTAAVNGPSMPLPVLGAPDKPPVSLPIPDAISDPRKLLLNPLTQFVPFNGKQPPDLKSMDTPFTKQAPALLEEDAATERNGGLRLQHDTVDAAAADGSVPSSPPLSVLLELALQAVHAQLLSTLNGASASGAAGVVGDDASGAAPDEAGGGGAGVDETVHLEPSLPGGASDTTFADMPICANEGSREFIFSLFRGVVGTLGDVTCFDMPPPAAGRVGTEK